MEDYEVGYRKPPRKHQFKPGQSGNPKGRPRKPRSPLSIDDAEILRRLDAEEISVGGRRMTRREAEIRRIFALSIHEPKARALFNRLMRGLPKSRGGGVLHMPLAYFQKDTQA